MFRIYIFSGLFFLFNLMAYADSACWQSCTAAGNTTKFCAKQCEISDTSDANTCVSYCTDRGGSASTCRNLCAAPIHSGEYCDSHPFDQSCNPTHPYCDSHPFDDKCGTGTHSPAYCDDHPFDDKCGVGDHSTNYCNSHPFDDKCKKP